MGLQTIVTKMKANVDIDEPRLSKITLWTLNILKL